MANQIKAMVYTDDNGVDHVIGMNKEVTTQMAGTDPDRAKVGGSAFNGTDALSPMPANIRPRKARVVNPAGQVRYVICLESDAPLFTTGGMSITLEDSDGASTVYTKNGTLGESSRRRHARTGV